MALTGEGINDLDGLRISDVGFSMGSGVSAAKYASKMILTDDNLLSIINAVLWGRNIYANVRKFIQFQFTVNFSALVLLLIVALIDGNPVFSVVQLLWINMIMDLMAALALAAEPPSPSTILNPPVRNKDRIITPVMWRQILGMTAYITAVMILLFFTIEHIMGSKEKRGTLLFNSFIFLHLFNEINCRNVNGKSLNVFEHIHRNLYFIFVFAATIAIQLLMVEYGGGFTQCSALDSQENAFCLLIGSTSLLASLVLKLLPESIDKNLPVLLDENKSANDSKFVKLYNKVNEAKVTEIKVNLKKKPA